MSSEMYNQNNEEKANKTAESRTAGSAGHKPGLSLAMKLNLRMFLHTLAVILLINVFLCAAAGLSVILNAEEEAASFMVNPKEQSDIVINTAPIQSEGFDLWAPLHQNTPLREYEVMRSFQLNNIAPPYIDDLSSLEYLIVFKEDGKDDLAFRFPLGTELLSYKNLFYRAKDGQHFSSGETQYMGTICSIPVMADRLRHYQ